MFITFHAITFENQTLLVQKCWHENRVWHKIATQGHKSFILLSVTSPQEIPYCHIDGDLCWPYVLVSEYPPKKIAENCCCRQPQSFEVSSPRNSLEYPHMPYRAYLSIEASVIGNLAYIVTADSIGLSSFKFVQWTPKHESFPQQNAYRPFKVIQGRWFWYQLKAHMRLPIRPS